MLFVFHSVNIAVSLIIIVSDTPYTSQKEPSLAEWDGVGRNGVILVCVFVILVCVFVILVCVFVILVCVWNPHEQMSKPNEQIT